MGESDCEGPSFVVAPDVTLQTVLAAKCLLTAVAGTVEWLLPYGMSRDKEVRTGSYGFIIKPPPRLKLRLNFEKRKCHK